MSSARQSKDPAQSVRESLEAARESWLIPASGPSQVETEMAFMRSCGALWDHVQSRFPETSDTPRTLSILQEVAVGVLRPTLGARMRAAGEPAPTLPRSGMDEAMAAARLAADGNSKEVLVATSIMSQGQSPPWTWGDRPETRGYLWLLPAICSALCADSVFRADALCLEVPPCYYSDGLVVRVPLLYEVRALRPGLSDDERSTFAEWAINEQAAFLEAEGWPHLVFDPEVTANAAPAVAAALGISPDSVGEESWPFERSLARAAAAEADADAGGNALLLEGALTDIEIASLFYWAASESHLLLTEGDGLEVTLRELPWVFDWYPQRMPLATWPPRKDLLLQALPPGILSFD